MSTLIQNKFTPLLLVFLATVPALSNANPEKVRQFGKKRLVTIDDLPASQIKDKLKKLTGDKQIRALSELNKISFTDLDLHDMRLSNEGKFLVVESLLPDKKRMADRIAKENADIQAGNHASRVLTSIDAFSLHSLPGASNIIYLDFDGETIANSSWNNNYKMASFAAVPFDTDGAPASFSASEINTIHEVWHRVSEDYAPFNVDVTTERPPSFGPTIGHAVITRNADANGVMMPWSSSGGVAYVNVWGGNYYEYYSPVLIYYNSLGSFAPYMADAASHEMGHNLGLSHDGYNDGSNVSEYYYGAGTGFVSWAPIMGIGYYQNVTQWSKGEYAFANQLQDDVGIIGTKLGFRADDVGDDAFSSVPLSVDGNGLIKATNPETDPFNINGNNKGVIEAASDVDFFSFDAGAGAINITVTPAWAAFTRNDKRGADLNIEAILYDQYGVQQAIGSSQNDTQANISATVPAGHYFLRVKGAGNTITPFSNYGSLGQYFISGNIVPGYNADTTPPSPNPMSFSVPPYSGGSTNSIRMVATVATDKYGAVQYNFVCAYGGRNCVDSGWQSSNQFIATGLDAGTSYYYQVKARDIVGNQTLPSNYIVATTGGAADTLAPKSNPSSWAQVPNGNYDTRSIYMAANIANDPAGGVQYRFICTAPVGAAGCVDSGWQASNEYVVTGVDVDIVTYSFRVQARDGIGNTTNLSNTKSTTVLVPLAATPTNLGGIRSTASGYSPLYDRISLTWDTVKYASSYSVWRCRETSSGCAWGQYPYGFSDDGDFQDNYADIRYLYRYKISAQNNSGSSPYSNVLRM